MIRHLAARLLGIDQEAVWKELRELERASRDALEVARAASAEVKQQRIDFELLYDKAANAVARLNQRTKKAAAAAEEPPEQVTPSVDDLNRAIVEGRVPLRRVR